MSQKKMVVTFLNNFPIFQYFVLEFKGEVVQKKRNPSIKFHCDWHCHDGEIYILIEAALILNNQHYTGLYRIILWKCKPRLDMPYISLSKFFNKKYWKLWKLLRQMLKVGFIFSQIIAETVGFRGKVSVIKTNIS